jgi:hypothetical protein
MNKDVIEEIERAFRRSLQEALAKDRNRIIDATGWAEAAFDEPKIRMSGWVPSSGDTTRTGFYPYRDTGLYRPHEILEMAEANG